MGTIVEDDAPSIFASKMDKKKSAFKDFKV